MGADTNTNGSAPPVNATTLHSELFYHRNLTVNQNTIALSSDRGSLEIAGVSLLYEGTRVKSYLLGRDLNPMGRGDGTLYAEGMFSAGDTRPIPNSNPVYGRGNSINNVLTSPEAEKDPGAQPYPGSQPGGECKLLSEHSTVYRCDLLIGCSDGAWRACKEWFAAVDAANKAAYGDCYLGHMCLRDRNGCTHMISYWDCSLPCNTYDQGSGGLSIPACPTCPRSRPPGDIGMPRLPIPFPGMQPTGSLLKGYSPFSFPGVPYSSIALPFPPGTQPLPLPLPPIVIPWDKIGAAGTAGLIATLIAAGLWALAAWLINYLGSLGWPISLIFINPCHGRGNGGNGKNGKERDHNPYGCELGCSAGTEYGEAMWDGTNLSIVCYTLCLEMCKLSKNPTFNFGGWTACMCMTNNLIYCNKLYRI